MSEELEKIMKQLDDRLDTFKKELLDGQDREAAAAARKARQEPKYVFKKKSHEEQSKINDKIDETMREAETELQPGGSSAVPSAENIKAALDALKQGRAMVAERQKLIKIADRSELGWAVVQEYTADELAANSDDEKRMEKAEKAAERKAARKRKAAPAGKSRVKRSTYTPFQPHPSPTAQFQLPLVKPHAPVHHQPTPKLPGPCYVCGQFGHLKNYCLTGPALRANPSPEVTDLFCRLPLPTLFYRPEAVHPWRPAADIGTTRHGSH